MATSSYNVIIEGNIGSGKSSLINYFAINPQVVAIQEPLNKWTNIGGVNLLRESYREPSKWGFPFQFYAAFAQLQAHNWATDRPFKIQERSIFSGRYCFLEQLSSTANYQNRLPRAQHQILEEWFQYILGAFDFKVDLVIYLRTTPDVAYERIQTRGRYEEMAVTIDQIKELHAAYDDWLLYNKFPIPGKVFILFF